MIAVVRGIDRCRKAAIDGVMGDWRNAGVVLIRLICFGIGYQWELMFELLVDTSEWYSAVCMGLSEDYTSIPGYFHFKVFFGD